MTTGNCESCADHNCPLAMEGVVACSHYRPDPMREVIAAGRKLHATTYMTTEVDWNSICATGREQS